jgi:hypothetical protein
MHLATLRDRRAAALRILLLSTLNFEFCNFSNYVLQFLIYCIEKEAPHRCQASP